MRGRTGLHAEQAAPTEIGSSRQACRRQRPISFDPTVSRSREKIASHAGGRLLRGQDAGCTDGPAWRCRLLLEQGSATSCGRHNRPAEGKVRGENRRRPPEESGGASKADGGRAEKRTLRLWLAVAQCQQGIGGDEIGVAFEPAAVGVGPRAVGLLAAGQCFG